MANIETSIIESSRRYKCIKTELEKSGSLERGLQAQLTMAPAGRIPDDYNPRPEGARQGAVLMVLSRDPQRGLEIPLIERTDNGGPHGGQIALPGGGMEREDRGDVTRTALREAREEIGTSKDDLEVVGTLFPLFVPVSNYSITPVVAVTGDSGLLWSKLTANPSEVQRILRVSVPALFSGRRNVSLSRYGIERTVPAFVASVGDDDIVVWGATAMMLAELEIVLLNCGVLG